MDLIYTQGRACREEIDSHLAACSEDFIPPLANRVCIRDYSAKLFERAVIFEAWSGTVLVGLAAVYYNDPAGRMAYITSISTLKPWMGQGVASRLMTMIARYAGQLRFECILLEVSKTNESAIHLYKKFGFREHISTESNVIMVLEIGSG